MKTPKILGVAFVLAQNLKRIADWSERPQRCLAPSAATNVSFHFNLAMDGKIVFTSIDAVTLVV